MPKMRFAAVVGALFIVAGCSSPFGLSDISQETSTLSAADRNFIAQAAYGSLAEVQLGRLAEQKAGNAAVREFGRMMATEHTRMNEDLIAIASKKGVTPPSSPDEGREAVADTLEQLSGNEFDRQYIPQQLADHEVELTLFENQSERGQDAELKQFAQQYTPVIQRHVNTLRRMSTQMVSMNTTSK
jgi:putative membrane protein